MLFYRQCRSDISAGFSLVEMLIVIGAIGIIAAIAVPTVSNIRESAKAAATTQNAKQIESMSQALASFGVAHVIPDSMGGVEATARLLREGVIIPEGPMAGERMKLSGMTDGEIEDVADYLYVEYDRTHLRLVFQEPADGGTMLLEQAVDIMVCLHTTPRPYFLLSLLAR